MQFESIKMIRDQVVPGSNPCQPFLKDCITFTVLYDAGQDIQPEYNQVQYEQTNRQYSNPGSTVPPVDNTGGEQHLHYIPGSNQVRCVTCNTMFGSKTTAKQHIKLVHQPQEWYECCFCKKVVRGRLYFSQHIGKKHFKGGQRVVESYGKRVPPPPGEL